MKDIYEFLKVKKDISDEVLTKKYEALKKELKEKMFLEGEAGNEAARNLTELKNLYKIAMQDRVLDTNEVYEEIENLANNNKIAEAQEKLDNLNVHDGKWHYLQSLIYYRNNWFDESKKQIILALSLEPDNERYKSVLNRLENMLISTNLNAYDNKQGDQPKNDNNNNNDNGNNIIAPCGGKNNCCKL